MRKINPPLCVLDITEDEFVLKPEVIEWLYIHIDSKYQLTDTYFSGDGPYLSFHDDVSDDIISWFLLRFSE